MAGMRSPICDALSIRRPVFGSSHSVDVVVAIAEAGSKVPVLSLALEMPREVPHLIGEVEAR